MTHVTSLRLITTPRQRRAVFSRLLDEGRLHSLLYDCAQYGFIEDLYAEFIGLASVKDAWAGVVMLDEQDASCFVVNSFNGKSAYIHFAVFKGFEHYAVPMGKYVCKWLFDSGIKALLGLTPVVYRHALAVAYGIGFEKQCTIPGACYMHRKDKFVDGVLTMKTPK